MHPIGIIAEYQPFHNGHAYQIAKIRKQIPDAAVIAVMSGGITQRGETSILDKHTSAELAVRGGCDLVLELPFLFSCRSAQDFARGGVRLLTSLGCVEYLAFGAETADITRLTSIVERLTSPAGETTLRQALETGLSYAAARTEVIRNIPGSAELLRQPNAILAVEYLRALNEYAPEIRPLLIKRRGAGYLDTSIDTPLASASAIRNALLNRESEPDWTSISRAVPEATLLTLKNAYPARIAHPERLYRPFQTALLAKSRTELRDIYGVAEGIENRIETAAFASTSRQTFLRNAATRHYPQSRLARTLIYILLNLTTKTVRTADNEGPLYIRPLAFNTRGRELLHTIRQTATLPIITRPAKHLPDRESGNPLEELTPLRQQLAFDRKAHTLAELTRPTPSHRDDFQQSPLFIR